MSLSAGARLGPYEIIGAIGAGGMGQVYKARDTRLDRQVAIKVLSPDLADEPGRRRFEREAQTIAGLSHPHVCTLHDVGEHDGGIFLVMEHLEGETLARRIEKGPLPIEQSLTIGAQIADALAAAHRRGIIHRDLKPANVMLTKTGVKLLDFGIARLTGRGEQAATGQMVSAPTQSAPLTAHGVIVGTLQYMAPEQIEGKPAEVRADIWAAGAILYEMLSGRPPFEASSGPSLIAGILSSQPVPLTSAQPNAPLALQRLVTKCLSKDPEQRWQCAQDLAEQLRWISDSVGQAVAAGRGMPSSWRTHAGWMVAGALAIAIAAGAALWSPPADRQRMFFHASVPFAVNDVAVSPDGRLLAMVAYSAPANNYVLWIHEVGGTRTDPLVSTDGASYPFWSPDGKSLAFFADGKLKKTSLAGGQPQVLCDATNGRGGTWNKDGLILFTPDAIGKGVFSVSSLGGTPAEVTSPDTAKLEQSHRWPAFLPDGKHFLYLAANFSGKSDTNAVYLAAIDSKERRRIDGTRGNAVYADPGYLVYMRDGKSLIAQRFDPQAAHLSGEPQTMSDEVLYLPAVDRAVFSLSGDVLVTQTGKGASLSRPTWFDRNGQSRGTVGDAGRYNNVRIAPDGRRVVADQTDADGRNVDIWVHDMTRDAKSRLTFDAGLDQTPIWSPDGKRILYISNRQLGFDMYIRNADASGSDEQFASLGTMVQVGVWDWSRDGRFVLVRKGGELWSLTPEDKKATPLIQADYSVRNAQLSPDGQWIAYSSNQTGTSEVYVSSFPAIKGKWQVSVAGGREPKWRADGRELYYLSRDGRMMAVGITLGASFEAGSPVPLFQTHPRQPVSAGDVFSYDVTADGQRFLVITKEDEPRYAPLTVLLNWAAGDLSLGRDHR